jgi:hypothetical protein
MPTAKPPVALMNAALVRDMHCVCEAVQAATVHQRQPPAVDVSAAHVTFCDLSGYLASHASGSSFLSHCRGVAKACAVATLVHPPISAKEHQVQPPPVALSALHVAASAVACLTQHGSTKPGQSEAVHERDAATGKSTARRNHMGDWRMRAIRGHCVRCEGSCGTTPRMQ